MCTDPRTIRACTVQEYVRGVYGCVWMLHDSDMDILPSAGLARENHFFPKKLNLLDFPVLILLLASNIALPHCWSGGSQLGWIVH